MKSRLGILVNPMSGRDVRRIAARATNMTHETKMDMVARIAVGADQAGIDELFIFNEPFRIATQALAWLDLSASVRVLDVNLHHDARDTEQAILKLQKEGVDTVVALGGDGTHRIIARTSPNLTLVPLSTGTNNVFPVSVEPTIAGMAAALAAKHQLPVTDRTLQAACKVLHLEFCDGRSDIALIDVVKLQDDFIGNFMPYDNRKIQDLILTCALPDAIGMSPIGGFLKVVEKADDFGLAIQLGSGHAFRAPISPGYFRSVSSHASSTLNLNQSITLTGPAVIALDGDREHNLRTGEKVRVTLRRDGPLILDVPAVMRHAVAASILIS